MNTTDSTHSRELKRIVSLLKEAIICGDYRTVSNLLTSSSSRLSVDPSTIVNSPLDHDGTSLLHLAANCSTKIIDLMITNGADINHQNADGYSALHVSAMNGCIEGVKILLANGVDVGLMDNDMMIARDYAEEEEQWEIVELLDEHTLKNVDILEEGEKNMDTSLCETFVKIMMDNVITDGDNYSVAEDTNGASTSGNLDFIVDEIEQLSLTELDHLEVTSPNTSATNDSVCSDLYVTAYGDQLYQDTTSVQESQSLPNLSSLTNSELREKLLSLGEQPGPITDLTRNAYIKYLMKILQGIQPSGNQGYKGFKYELALCLNGTVPLPNFKDEEKKVFAEFRVAGQFKSFFNYFLLDPRTLETGSTSETLKQFQHFVESIFYVGKGKNARCYQHLKGARTQDRKTKSAKVKRILDIWESGVGVISLHLFNGIAAGEAYCREAAIIQIIGLDNLTNAVKGHFHGVMTSWPASRQRLFGVFLLQKAFQSFLIDTPQQLFPQDI